MKFFNIYEFPLLTLQELTCGIGGEWSGKAPTCKFVDCGAPAAIDNGRYNLVNGTTTFASIVEYTCNEDYWLEPQNRRRQTCTRDGNWSSEAPVCECKSLRSLYRDKMN